MSKHTNLYLFPIGPALWLSNIVYINRKDTQGSIKALENMRIDLTEKKLKICMYPEGTRNKTPQKGFLPFKKGAFFSAIKAQVPIIPCVSAPYGYIDQDKGVFLSRKSKYFFLMFLN